jgi:hypothetical protein
MKKTTVWALALALAGMTIVSCDSTSSPPPADNGNNDTTSTPTTTTPSADPSITMITPSSSDTSIVNDVTALTLRFKAGSKTGITAKVNGAAAQGSSEFTYKITGIPVGISKYTVVTSNGTSTDTNVVSVTRQLGAPFIKATTGQPGQTDFTDSVTVQFTAADVSTDSMRYTTSGASSKILSSDPLVASGFTKPIKGTTTFRAIAVRRNSLGVVYSDTTTVTFLIGKTLGKPYFSTNRLDSFNYVSKVAIGGFGVGDTVRYTTDGGDPSRDSYIYSKTDSILVQSGMTIIAKSFNGGNSSPACTTTIKLNALPPVFSVKSGTYTSQRYLSIKSLSGIPVYYTTDGSDPNNSSLKAGDTLLIASNMTVKAMAILPGWNSSSISSASYKFKVATPTLSFKTGNYDTTQTLSITDSAEGADIRYSLDNSTPNCGSTKYYADSALKLDSNVTVKAVACKVGWDSSDVAVGNYTFKVAKIVFAPDSGVYRSYQAVKLSTRSPNVTFFVTRDSTTPAWNASGDPTGTTQKKLPGDTLFIQKSQWLRVIAMRNGWANSIADSRRYVVEGDTLLVDDFEQNSLTNPIGVNWRFWGCGNCVSTGIPDQIETFTNTADPDWNKHIGFRNGHISFNIPEGGATRISDGGRGPGMAGYSVGVPADMMGETYRIAFWARWKPSGTTTNTSVPMVTEIVLKGNDKQNGNYDDGFLRYVDTIGTTWKRFILDYSAFFPASNAYLPSVVTDSTNTTPKSYWIIRGLPFYDAGSSVPGYPDSGRMIQMGLSKFQGWVAHSGTWTPKWVWGVDHDLWVKNDITNFKWSIIQPNTNKVGLAALTNGEWVVQGTKDTSYIIQAANVPGPGTHDSTVTRLIPNWIYCGDCHQPVEPDYSVDLASGFKALEGSLELDRIQLIRRPQISGGLIISKPAADTTTKK